jgi:hypothetical protein
MSHDVDRVRAVMRVRWDGARQRKVLAGALRSHARREDRSRATRWLALAAASILLARALPRASVEPNESVDRAFSASPLVTHSRPPSIDEHERRRGEGGFAGMRGSSRGARGNGGTGGGAGTG